jgi:GH15 family glucan-1,4-alpha-glucosidase
MIGDRQTAALVSLEGSIDWLCVPRFDSGACFSALLGTREHGRWRLSPMHKPTAIRRSYRKHTLILETEFDIGQSTVRLIDFMPIRTDHPDIIRIVEGVKGVVKMEMEFIARFEYGSYESWIQKADDGIFAIAGPDLIHLSSAVPLERKHDAVRAEFEIKQGEEKSFVLSYQRSYLPLPEIAKPAETLISTEEYWTEWASKCTYNGPYQEDVIRSLITIHGLIYQPTGGIVAAATTSLPEQLGGERNWDYRYCWLRDATFSLYALLISGYTQEAIDWRKWLLRAVAGNPEQMQILYGVTGERRVSEWIAEWLPGFESSTPVRIGNAAHTQFQLDVYGEIMDSMYLACRAGLKLSTDGWDLQKKLVATLAEKWKEPDEGIWEVRGPRRHFTHSKVMAWVAVDRIIKSAELFKLDGPMDQWRALRRSIHDDVCMNGFNKSLNSFVQYYGSNHLDSSLLMLPQVGFLPHHDSRIIGTLNAIQKYLTKDGFLLRYITRPELDGLTAGEGVFLPCSFWLVDNLILQGRRKEAQNLFQRLLQTKNEVGLFSEEYDPETKRQVGNFPQAWCHVALVNSAWNLSRETGPAHDRGKTEEKTTTHRENSS